MNTSLQIIVGDSRTALKELPDELVQCCVTSPPYWGLRDYGVAGQIGQEGTPEQYIETLTQVFHEIWRVLRQDGTVWLNLGDCYFGSGKGFNKSPCKQDTNKGSRRGNVKSTKALGKPKDLVMIPARVALALQADGWWIRSDIIWHKPNCMPESVTDRPSCCHEHLFLLTKSEKYYYDAEAIKEPCSDSYIKDSRWITGPKEGNSKEGYDKSGAQNPKRVHSVFKNFAAYNGKNASKQNGHGRRHAGFNSRWDEAESSGRAPLMRNKRNVWTVSPAIYMDAHFATFPPELIKPCILAGTKPGDVVLDPFGGSGTTGMVAQQLGRGAILIELNPEYAELCRQRCNTTIGLPL